MTDQTAPAVTGEKHPSIAELRSAASNPSESQHIAAHVGSCAMCRSIVSAASDDEEAPIVLDLPKGLVDESAFRWPAQPIAQGGMAQIFAGEDKRLGRTVILKAPREGEELSAGMADMFQRRVTAEAKILAKLQHPSIVKIYELGKSTVGWPFCVMERVDGISLRDKLDELADIEKKENRACTRERLELLSSLVSVAEALAYAHERRVVHRDCTPNNILLGKRGEATLIDWGIARDLDAPGAGGTEAKLLDDNPATSGRMVTISAGTPPYLPLEQSQGRRADPTFDVYSFGITLYEVVSGTTPFEWKPEVDRTRQLENFLDWLKAGETVAPAMPQDPELSGIIAKAMTRDPAERFTSDELVRALKQYLTGDLVFSHRYSATGRMARWMRRNRAITVGIISLLVFAIAGALVWIQLSRARAEEAELRAIAAAARVDAAEKQTAADEAERKAQEANALAAKAQGTSQEAQALRAQAERARKQAEALRRDAESAAKSAKGTADEAVKRYQEAMKAKEDAEKARDAALEAQRAAEKARDAATAASALAAKAQASAEDLARRAKDAQDRAERERDEARKAQAQAEKDREDARKGQHDAEVARDEARKVQVEAEKARDEARRKLDVLEARVKELEQRAAGGGGSGPSGGSSEPPPPPPP